MNTTGSLFPAEQAIHTMQEKSLYVHIMRQAEFIAILSKTSGLLQRWSTYVLVTPALLARMGSKATFIYTQVYSKRRSVLMVLRAVKENHSKPVLWNLQTCSQMLSYQHLTLDVEMELKFRVSFSSVNARFLFIYLKKTIKVGKYLFSVACHMHRRLFHRNTITSSFC